MIVDRIANANVYTKIVKNLDHALDLINGNMELALGVYEFPGGKVIVTDGDSQALDSKQFEAHQNYADVMMIVEGSETVSYLAKDDLVESKSYDAAEDYALFTSELSDILVSVPAGYFYVMMPGEGHKPCVHVKDAQYYKKYIIKCKQVD